MEKETDKELDVASDIETLRCFYNKSVDDVTKLVKDINVVGAFAICKHKHKDNYQIVFIEKGSYDGKITVSNTCIYVKDNSLIFNKQKYNNIDSLLSSNTFLTIPLMR